RSRRAGCRSSIRRGPATSWASATSRSTPTWAASRRASSRTRRPSRRRATRRAIASWRSPRPCRTERLRLALPQPFEDLGHVADVGVAVAGRTAEEALARLVLAYAALLTG